MDILIPALVWLVALILTLFSLVVSSYQWALFSLVCLVIWTVIFYLFVVFVCLRDKSDDTKPNE